MISTAVVQGLVAHFESHWAYSPRAVSCIHWEKYEHPNRWIQGGATASKWSANRCAPKSCILKRYIKHRLSVCLLASRLSKMVVCVCVLHKIHTKHMLVCERPQQSPTPSPATPPSPPPPTPPPQSHHTSRRGCRTLIQSGRGLPGTLFVLLL